METDKKHTESPCIRNCCLDENDICLGCFRSIVEITQWNLVDEQSKIEFLKKAEIRKNKVFLKG